jgi:hypothetical protein
MGGSAIKGLPQCETPVFMRLLKNPADGYNATWRWVKSRGKARFPQDFCGFCIKFAIFLGIFAVLRDEMGEIT